MSENTWDPERYLTYADQRGRPFFDLLSRVAATEPRRMVDLGCGPGNLTRTLAARWPSAQVLGVDSSVEMIDEARAHEAGGVRFEVGDVRGWGAADPIDVLVSNAALQWVPGHLDLLPHLVAQVAPGGWCAFQVPGNFAGPSHVLLRELGADNRFSPYLQGIARPESHDPVDYLDALAGLGCVVDAWESTYLHVLDGVDPVFRWISETGARPTLQALPDDLRPSFEAEYKQLLRDAYPPREHGTVLPFRRVFVVAKLAG